jgi:hypothetical protein
MIHGLKAWSLFGIRYIHQTKTDVTSLFFLYDVTSYYDTILWSKEKRQHVITKLNNSSRIIQHVNHLQISNDSLYSKKYVCKQIIQDWNNLLLFYMLCFFFWELSAVVSNAFRLNQKRESIKQMHKRCTHFCTTLSTSISWLNQWSAKAFVGCEQVHTY